jgi:hypothetical protein
LETPKPSEPEPVVKAIPKRAKEDPKPIPPKDTLPTQRVQKEITKTELKPTSEHSDIVDKEISGLENLSKNPSPAEKEVDEAKLKEIKREEEIAKAKQAMERKKKLAEKAAAKAAARAQKDAEKKLKVISLFLYFNHYLVYYLLSDTKKRGFLFFEIYFRSVKRN